MTALLKQAFDRAAAQPGDGRDAIAGMVLEEIEDEARWRASFATSWDALARLAGRARAEIARGDVLPADRAAEPE